MRTFRKFLTNSDYESNREKVGLAVYYLQTYGGEEEVAVSDIGALFNINDIPMSESAIAAHLKRLADERLVLYRDKEYSSTYLLTARGFERYESLAGEQSQSGVTSEESPGLNQVLSKGETETIEFKREFPDNARQMAKETVAIANKQGGVLILGVKDDGTPVGMSDVPSIEERLINVLRDNIEPNIDINVEFETQSNEDILMVRIPEAEEVPFAVKGTYYKRIGTTVQKMTGVEMRKWFEEND